MRSIAFLPTLAVAAVNQECAKRPQRSGFRLHGDQGRRLILKPHLDCLSSSVPIPANASGLLPWFYGMTVWEIILTMPQYVVLSLLGKWPYES